MIDIDFFYKSGIISNLNYYFALILCKTAKEKDPVMLLSAALTSMAAINGNVCLDIDDYAGKTVSECDFSEFIDLSRTDIQSAEFPEIFLPGNALSDSTLSESEKLCLKFPEKINWMESITNSSITGKTTESPLVYDGKSRLYLARYYDFQQRIVENIIQRTKKK